MIQKLNHATKKNTLLQNLLIFLAIWLFALKVSNNAMDNLLQFIKFFIKTIGMVFYYKEVESSSDFVPINLKSLHKSLGNLENDYLIYTVCPKCDSIYAYDDCILMRANGKNESKTCRHVSYPRHPHLSKELHVVPH